MTQLSPNFSLEELTRSSTGIRLGLDNTPNAEQTANLMRLANTALERARAILGCPIHIDSGYRSLAVNHAVGSRSAHSLHLDGRAADIVPMGVPLRVAFDDLRKEMLDVIDEIIIEGGAWIHIGIAAVGAKPRQRQEIATYLNGIPSYQLAGALA